MNAQQRAGLDAALRRGAHAHGFSTDLWTLPRVATVIERLTGVHHHPGHVWYLLRRLNWSLQRPAWLTGGARGVDRRAPFERRSTESWTTLLRDLQRRGLCVPG